MFQHELPCHPLGVALFWEIAVALTWISGLLYLLRCSRERRTYLGRVIRDIERKLPLPDAQIRLLERAKQIKQQQRSDSNKIYSMHVVVMNFQIDYEVSRTVELWTVVSQLSSPCRLVKRRSAIEPVIGHLKQDHALKRNYLQGSR